MTNALLHRTRAFARVGGVRVDILTLDGRPDYPDIERTLRDRGDLVEGTRIVNLWDWLREHPLPGGSLKPARHPFDPIDPVRDAAELDAPRRRGDRVLSRTRRDGEGTVLQIDHYRLDGTLLASDRRDVRQRGVLGGRSITLCDELGRPVRSWGRIWHLYSAWLDAVTEKQRSWMIVDSKTVANYLLVYRRKHVVTMHAVHASHLIGQERPHGRLRESRRPVFENLGGYDGVVLLTQRQRDDVEAMLGPHDNLYVIPNARDLGDLDPERVRLDRDPGHGVMLAALTARKRVDHAIRAVTDAAVELERLASEHSTELEVFGDGELRGRVEKLVATRRHGDHVHLRGFDPEAARHLQRASYLLLTSTSEGFPLVLVESMAAGCLPIVYDVPYGPADIVRDGRNGFLVPAGDIAGLARAIERVTTMPAEELARMRREAVRTAARYSDERVTEDWARAFRRAALSKQLKRSEEGVTVTRLRLARFVIGRAVRARLARVTASRGR